MMTKDIGLRDLTFGRVVLGTIVMSAAAVAFVFALFASFLNDIASKEEALNDNFEGEDH